MESFETRITNEVLDRIEEIRKVVRQTNAVICVLKLSHTKSIEYYLKEVAEAELANAAKNEEPVIEPVVSEPKQRRIDEFLKPTSKSRS